MFGSSSMKFQECVGSKIAQKTGDNREMEHLLQCILLAAMWDNAYSVMADSRWLK